MSVSTTLYNMPRLAGRLTAELIVRCPQQLNAVKDYELDLRGNKIAAIENMGSTENQFDSIDLSDNEIVKLEGFCHLKRLRVLLLNNNRIARIGEDLGDCLPFLETLVLTNNRLTNLADIDNLATLPALKHLSLLDNIIVKKPNYRLYVIHKLPNLKVLDFSRIKPKEREASVRVFGESVAPTAATTEPAPKKAKTFEPGEDIEAAKPAEEAPKATGPTPEQLTAIKIAIANATTLEEVARLEKALKSGQMPDDKMDEG